MKLVDITLRPEGSISVETEPDNTVEIIVSEPGASVTLLLTPDQAKALRDALAAEVAAQ